MNISEARAILKRKVFLWRRELIKHRHSVQHTYDTSCGTIRCSNAWIDTHGLCGSILKKWYASADAGATLARITCVFNGGENCTSVGILHSTYCALCYDISNQPIWITIDVMNNADAWLKFLPKYYDYFYGGEIWMSIGTLHVIHVIHYSSKK
jgi:hypothetical protein